MARGKGSAFGGVHGFQLAVGRLGWEPQRVRGPVAIRGHKVRGVAVEMVAVRWASGSYRIYRAGDEAMRLRPSFLA